ncbi:hypothetical protein [Nitrospirillum sp. BR 11828]|uniref:hypothetical protein n=1 Tax=Nitrospirillum sp. BR 11828 TaxID=3104325 RepID=UPI002ACAFC14|nr:hypothetical protein [Nitrospirillum sp. BR 11828]MDZ5646219.1 hypothetical protein [Nitrospirillum sp. BR 11828]
MGNWPCFLFFTVWLVEMFTTAGSIFSTRGAKLCGGGSARAGAGSPQAVGNNSTPNTISDRRRAENGRAAPFFGETAIGEGAAKAGDVTVGPLLAGGRLGIGIHPSSFHFPTKGPFSR